MEAENIRIELASAFAEKYGDEADSPILAAWAPGRCELAGNHTDHQGGHVIATAVDRFTRGLFRANGTQEIRFHSVGFEPFRVCLDDLSPKALESGTSAAIVRGLASQFEERGMTPAGFDALLVSDVASGSGISSSAAFELCVASAMNKLWAGGSLSALDLAKMSHWAENRWFGKPCGLMDQMAVALGGVNAFDFSDPHHPRASAIDFDFAESGYSLVLVNVGVDHSVNIFDYAAVPGEMHAVAEMLGAERLCEVKREDLYANLGEIRSELGDRPVLRAMGYWQEDFLTQQRQEALCRHDMATFCELTRLSSANSVMLLQNVTSGGSSQPMLVAIALANGLLKRRGAARVHGGGFGGTILCVVPADEVAGFVAAMDAALGEGACGVYRSVFEGACAEWM